MREDMLRIRAAFTNDLKHIDVDIPLGKLTVIIGVSGSGKSSLTFDTIYKEDIVDQKPIGRKSTSTPISYFGGLERIRELLANTSYAKEHDYGKGLFSKNSEGRCLCCQGLGEISIDIGLGNQLFLRCEDCDGTGYVSEALEVNYNGKNIYEIMQMSFAEAESSFKQDKKLFALMTVMVRVVMGYMKLGQKTTTISGGEPAS